ncbi:hypothetical protein GCM10010246_43350 [Streptomyces cuspidosporus]|uniref:Uncharacterized protein n=1 Tax=Streptomyces cuspidosporus TaxID=66882 RepID=A0ABN3GFP8_9ACTN
MGLAAPRAGEPQRHLGGGAGLFRGLGDPALHGFGQPRGGQLVGGVGIPPPFPECIKR